MSAEADHGVTTVAESSAGETDELTDSAPTAPSADGTAALDSNDALRDEAALAREDGDNMASAVAATEREPDLRNYLVDGDGSAVTATAVSSADATNVTERTTPDAAAEPPAPTDAPSTGSDGARVDSGKLEEWRLESERRDAEGMESERRDTAGIDGGGASASAAAQEQQEQQQRAQGIKRGLERSDEQEREGKRLAAGFIVAETVERRSAPMQRETEAQMGASVDPVDPVDPVVSVISVFSDQPPFEAPLKEPAEPMQQDLLPAAALETLEPPHEPPHEPTIEPTLEPTREPPLEAPLERRQTEQEESAHQNVLPAPDQQPAEGSAQPVAEVAGPVTEGTAEVAPTQELPVAGRRMPDAEMGAAGGAGAVQAGEAGEGKGDYNRVTEAGGGGGGGTSAGEMNAGAVRAGQGAAEVDAGEVGAREIGSGEIGSGAAIGGNYMGADGAEAVLTHGLEDPAEHAQAAATDAPAAAPSPAAAAVPPGGVPADLVPPAPTGLDHAPMGMEHTMGHTMEHGQMGFGSIQMEENVEATEFQRQQEEEQQQEQEQQQQQRQQEEQQQQQQEQLQLQQEEQRQQQEQQQREEQQRQQQQHQEQQQQQQQQLQLQLQQEQEQQQFQQMQQHPHMLPHGFPPSHMDPSMHMHPHMHMQQQQHMQQHMHQQQQHQQQHDHMQAAAAAAAAAAHMQAQTAAHMPPPQAHMASQHPTMLPHMGLPQPHMGAPQAHMAPPQAHMVPPQGHMPPPPGHMGAPQHMGPGGEVVGMAVTEGIPMHPMAMHHAMSMAPGSVSVLPSPLMPHQAPVLHPTPVHLSPTSMAVNPSAKSEAAISAVPSLDQPLVLSRASALAALGADPEAWNRLSAVRRRVAVTGQVKKEICELKLQLGDVSQDEMVEQVNRRYGVRLSRTTVSKILKDAPRWLRVSGAAAKQKRCRMAKFPQMEASLAHWYRQVSALHGSISDAMIVDKARQLSVELSIQPDEFKVSDGWLYRFKRRHELPTARKRGAAPPGIKPEEIGALPSNQQDASAAAGGMHGGMVGPYTAMLPFGDPSSHMLSAAMGGAAGGGVGGVGGGGQHPMLPNQMHMGQHDPSGMGAGLGAGSAGGMGVHGMAGGSGLMQMQSLQGVRGMGGGPGGGMEGGEGMGGSMMEGSESYGESEEEEEEGMEGGSGGESGFGLSGMGGSGRWSGGGSGMGRRMQMVVASAVSGLTPVDIERYSQVKSLFAGALKKLESFPRL